MLRVFGANHVDPAFPLHDGAPVAHDFDGRTDFHPSNSSYLKVRGKRGCVAMVVVLM